VRAELERAVGKLEQVKPDILIGLFADELGEDEEDWTGYNTFKSLTVGRGLPSQVVYQSTLRKSHAMGNIVLGVVGKTGSIPYVRTEALPYADMVVGIDIARKKKERLTGSMNATAITRIYFSNGEFLRYVIHDAPLEGETLPANVIHGFPVHGGGHGERSGRGAPAESNGAGRKAD
jgi:argonaute-like protein implicated in RNA metabolism and viral defense